MSNAAAPFSTASLFDSPTRTVVNFAALFILIATFTPLFPVMPNAGLDPSWQAGMNQAVAQGLVFGREMIFTFGPYASIFTRVYHPATDTLMITGSLYLAVLLWINLLLLTNVAQYKWLMVLCLIIAGVSDSRDALLTCIALAISLNAYKNFIWQQTAIVNKQWQPLLIAFLFSPLGLLILVKGSLLIINTIVVALCAIFFLVNQKKLSALACVAGPFFSMLFFWLCAGQLLTNLPGYFISMVKIIAGYPEAMANYGNASDIIEFSIGSILLLLAVYFRIRSSASKRLFLITLYVLVLFFAFKAGFTRHDDIHVLIAMDAVLIAACMLPLIQFDKYIGYATGFAIVIGINANHLYSLAPNFASRIDHIVESTCLGLTNRAMIQNWLQDNYDLRLAQFKQRLHFPPLQGTTDLYSYNQTFLFAAGYSWSPRPILQSYSAYTAALADLNKQHLTGPTAPKNIIFQVSPIDNRFPSIEDGASWPVLMTNYQATSLLQDYLFLEKIGLSNRDPDLVWLNQEPHELGQQVLLPQTNQPVFVRIDLHPTLLGKMTGIIYKARPLMIEINLKDGQHRRYRISAGLASSAFLLSPLIENTPEFAMLMMKSKQLELKNVQSMTIRGSTLFWDSNYTLQFSQMPYF